MKLFHRITVFSACMLTFAEYDDAADAINDLRNVLPEDVEICHTKTDLADPGKTTVFAFHEI